MFKQRIRVEQFNSINELGKFINDMFILKQDIISTYSDGRFHYLIYIY